MECNVSDYSETMHILVTQNNAQQYKKINKIKSSYSFSVPVGLI